MCVYGVHNLTVNVFRSLLLMVFIEKTVINTCTFLWVPASALKSSGPIGAGYVSL